MRDADAVPAGSGFVKVIKLVEHEEEFFATLFLISARNATSTCVMGGSAKLQRARHGSCGRKFIVGLAGVVSLILSPGCCISTTSRRTGQG